ncbi:helix-turn-helix domain-containing protein [Pseudomonas sp. NY15435]|uniref:helix-turn-helix domain-containing protein n=1 Tax=Pseudomonas sp. NY15435 TaxID=3400358 RepID=UPI003A89EED5
MSKTVTPQDTFCSACLRVLPLENSRPQCGELTANWGQGARHAGENYRLSLCEACFFYALSSLRRDQRTVRLFDDAPWPDEERFGRVDHAPPTTMEVLPKPTLLEHACAHWFFVEPLLRKPANERDYLALVEVLDQLLAMIGNDEMHPFSGLSARIGDSLEEYDATHYPASQVSAAAMLHYLMTEHDLTPADLPEVADAKVVGDLLSGKRQPTRRQIVALSKRFGVSPDVFL